MSLVKTDLAIEVKGRDQIYTHHLKGLKRFSEEYQVKKLILVSNDPIIRQINHISLLPWNIFLDKLWSGEIFS